MFKLTLILGEGLLAKIKNEQSELFQKLMDHVELRKQITQEFCREILAQYGLNLDEEKRLRREQYANQFRNDSTFLNESTLGGEEGALNISTLKNSKDSIAKSSVSMRKDGSKETMTSFVEWSFQNRASNA